jgi:hypothetical protein
MESKTAKVTRMVEQGKWLEALAIAKSFRLGFTKDELSTLKRAHEMQNNEDFYTTLGFSKKLETGKAIHILIEHYMKGVLVK